MRPPRIGMTQSKAKRSVSFRFDPITVRRLKDHAAEAGAGQTALAASRKRSAKPGVKLLLDEMISPRIARELRADGHDVQAIKADRPELEAASDRAVLLLSLIHI